MAQPGIAGRGLSDEVAKYVRELIFAGRARPGDFLRLEPVAEALGVSNTPVREALLTLSSEGYVRLVPRRGFVVESFSPNDVRDLFWTQAKLFGELASRSAEGATETELEELKKLLVEDEAAFESRDRHSIALTGDLLHRRVNRSARSPRLASILSSVIHHLPARFYAELEDHVEQAHGDHQELVEALCNRDSWAARQIAERHILDATDHLVELLRKRGLWAT